MTMNKHEITATSSQKPIMNSPLPLPIKTKLPTTFNHVWTLPNSSANQSTNSTPGPNWQSPRCPSVKVPSSSVFRQRRRSSLARRRSSWCCFRTVSVLGGDPSWYHPWPWGGFVHRPGWLVMVFVCVCVCAAVAPQVFASHVRLMNVLMVLCYMWLGGWDCLWMEWSCLSDIINYDTLENAFVPGKLRLVALVRPTQLQFAFTRTNWWFLKP